MSYERINKRVFRCTCNVCGHTWDADVRKDKPREGLPDRCKSRDCRLSTWDGVDKRRGSFTRVRKGSTK